MKITPILRFVLLLSICIPCLAEEDFDFELEFGIKQKSTLADFPLQEIGADELSNAAIGDALGSSAAQSANTEGKPAYEEQNELDNKRKKEELKISNSNQNVDDFLRNSLAPQAPQFPQQVFSEDLGRTVQHNNTAFERP